MNGVMLQAFHWFLQSNFPQSQGRKLWAFLRDEAAHLRSIGIDAVWLPPAYRGDDADGVGYDVYDHYNVGEFARNTGKAETRYGTKKELHQAIQSLHGKDNTEKRIAVYADIVLNHRAGGKEDNFWEAIRVDKEQRTTERWGTGWQEGKIEIKSYTKFEFPERGSKYSSFTWGARHFDSVDTAISIRQNGNTFKDGNSYIYRFLSNEAGFDPAQKNFDRWVDLEKGNFDYLTACDFDYGRPDVREEMKKWGEWYVREFDFDGVRLDAVKHISAHYMQEWLGHVRWKAGSHLFAVAEYISGSTESLHNYIKWVTTSWDFPQPVTLFDFPLFFKFNSVGLQGEKYDLANLFAGTLVAEQPTLAVTFVENHDYEYGRGWQCHVAAWFKPLAYAFILLRAGGYPCIFFPDYYGSVGTKDHQAYFSGQAFIDLLLKLRKQFALGAELSYTKGSIAGWTRLGFVPGAKGAMAVVMNTAYNRVQDIRMHTGRSNRSFYHLATIKLTDGGYLVSNGLYNQYGDKKQNLKTNAEGWGDFVADGGSVSIWLEEGTSLA